MRATVIALALSTALSWAPFAFPTEAIDEPMGNLDYRDAGGASDAAELVAAEPEIDDVADDVDAEPAVVAWTNRATVTAYCHGGLMRSGRQTYVGAVATDRRYIPEGSLIAIEGLGGPYVSEDTGSGVLGWWVDVFTPDCGRARQIGRSQRAIRVDRWGW